MTKISGPLTINFYLHNPVRLIDEKSTDFISQTVGLINTKSIHQNNIIVGNGARRPPPSSLPVLPMRMRRRAVTNLRTNPAVAIVPPQICGTNGFEGGSSASSLPACPSAVEGSGGRWPSHIWIRRWPPSP